MSSGERSGVYHFVNGRLDAMERVAEQPQPSGQPRSRHGSASPSQIVMRRAGLRSAAASGSRKAESVSRHDRNRPRLFAALLAGAFTFALTSPSFAETARRTSDDAKEQSSEANRLPADVTTDQTVGLPGRTLRFKAIAGSIPIDDPEGKLQAKIAYMAYVRPDGDAASRPIAFAFNRGPGASSAYLHLGAIGP